MSFGLYELAEASSSCQPGLLLWQLIFVNRIEKLGGFLQLELWFLASEGRAEPN